MEDFRVALEECGLADLGFSGHKFTWTNRRPGLVHTKQRLDRATANRVWMEKFPASSVSHLFSHASDHLPILLKPMKDRRVRGSGAGGFKFEENWLLWADFEEVMIEAWVKGGGDNSGLRGVRDHIKTCGVELYAWGSSKTKLEIEEIKRLQKKLELMNESELIEESRSDFLLNANGVWVEEVEEVAEVASDYFMKIFIVGTCDRMEDCLNTVPTKLTNDMQEVLSRPYSNEEVRAALFQMGPTKAPGLDGRLITDNMLVAYETLHAMHIRRKGKKGALALKLDVSKAYDSVEWSFFKGMMIKLGFPEVWVDRVMKCVSTPSFSVRINGKAYGNVIPSKELNGRLHGVVVCKNAPCITNLFFADGSLIFCQANKDEVQVVSDTLQLYAEAFGQCINLEKSSAYFNSNVSMEHKAWIVDKLKVPLSRRVVQDSLVWFFAKNDRYSVKSEYHVAKQLRMVENSSGKALQHRASTSLWSWVWKARVPNKDVWDGSAIRFQKFKTKQVDFRQLVASLMPKLSLEE
ncbi:hypothetical protein SO802_018303 [Lithocarpus litseifolius]|uniref:Reverse transcriptase domain-containing protein n=1 Tax=Lithocarpus litseifolius TaxID=425828 RepID=A0AAW2CQ76_9ROSI